MNKNIYMIVLMLSVLFATGCHGAANTTISESDGLLSFFMNPDGSSNLLGYIVVWFVVFWVTFFMTESDRGIGSPMLVSVFVTGMIYLIIYNESDLGSDIDKNGDRSSAKYEKKFKEKFGNLDNYNAYDFKFRKLDDHEKIYLILANREYMFLFFENKDITQKCPYPLYRSDKAPSYSEKEPIVMYKGKWYINKRIKPFASKERTIDYIQKCLNDAIKTFEESAIDKEHMKENINSWEKQDLKY